MPPSVAEVHAALTAPGQPFEMEEVLIRGVATRTWKNAAPSLRAVLEQSLVHRDLTFLVYEDESLTFEQHFAAAATMAHRLAADFGVQKGDRVAIAMRNFPEWSIAFWAAASLGAVVVPLNAWWTGPELEYGLSDSGSVVVFVDDERNERLAEHLTRASRVPRRHRRQGGARARGSGAAFRRCARRRSRPTRHFPASSSIPRTTRRSSTRRARPDGRRARSAPSATSAPT